MNSITSIKPYNLSCSHCYNPALVKPFANTVVIFFWTIILQFMPAAIFAQQTDSLSITQTVRDSLKRDTVATIDSSITIKKKPQAAIQDKIPYKANKIAISVDGNTIYLNGNAEIKYQNLTLNAEKITIDKKHNKLFAEGVLDSVDAKGNKVYRGNPVFVEKGREPMYGNKIEYDFITKRGKIDIGRTNMEPGYYKGDNIYKIADSTLLVEDGYFTTCDLPDHPHYYFRSDQMRIKLKDKVVARPIYFYIADIPIAVIPFGVFPNKGGRHSGLIMPSYGESRFGGRFLDNFGYYWAPNDYMDATLQTTFYEKLGFTFRGDLRYNLRYYLNGSLKGSYYPKDPNTGQRRERWSFSYRHNQTIDPTFHISGSGSFQSDKNFRKETSADINERLNQNITSTLNISKSWKGTKNSMSLSFSQNRNLQTNETSWTFPSLIFRRGQSSIYESLTGNPLGTNRAWYQDIYFSYNSNVIRRGSHKLNPAYGVDTLNNKEFLDKVSAGIQHSLSFSSPQKIFKYFSINPSLSYNEIWVDEITRGRLNADSTAVQTYQKKQFAVRRTFRSSIGLNTKLYGLFEPNIGDLKFIRHTITPSVSFSYTPDFSQNSFGYFDNITDKNGHVTQIDKFANSPFGGTSRNESRNMNISLNNLFQAKFIDDEGKEKKVDFFTANFSTSHNFKADSLKWSNLRSSFRTHILGKDITFTTIHSLYNLGKKGKVIDQLFYEKGKLPRLINFNTSFGYTINDKTFASKEDQNDKKSRKEKRNSSGKAQTEAETSVTPDSLQNEFITDEQQKEKDITKNIKLPWSMSFNLNYSYSKTDPNNPYERISLSTNAEFKLSQNWKIRWQANFDLVKKDLVYQTFNIYRDLHCWEMSFNWQPSIQYYKFQINIKEPILKDIKVTKRPRNVIYPNY